MGYCELFEGMCTIPLYATTAILAHNPLTFSVADNWIAHFSKTGIALSSTEIGSITHNLIHNEASATPLRGTGIRLTDASPALEANKLYYLQQGLLFENNSSPWVTANEIMFNAYGISITGSSAEGALNPAPVIQNNNLSMNQSAAVYVSSFGEESEHVIDLTQNYWGDEPVTLGEDIRFYYSADTLINHANPLANNSKTEL